MMKQAGLWAGLALALAPMAPMAATPLTPAAAFAAVKADLESAPVLFVQEQPTPLRITGDVCASWVVTAGFSGPVGDPVVVHWAEMGEAHTQRIQGGPLDGKYVVVFSQGGFVGVAPYDEVTASKTSRDINALIAACGALPAGATAGGEDDWLALATALNALATDMQAVNGTDIGGRAFTYRLEIESGPCHINAMMREPGEQGGWLKDNTLGFEPRETASVRSTPLRSSPAALVLQGGLISSYWELPMDTVERVQRVAQLYSTMQGLCARFRTSA